MNALRQMAVTGSSVASGIFWRSGRKAKAVERLASLVSARLAKLLFGFGATVALTLDFGLGFALRSYPVLAD
jgi:hypothetical protein